MATKNEVQELFFQIDGPIQAGLGDNPRPIDEVLRVHLLTETIMERLIALVLGKSADAVLSAKLTYGQKLSICGDLKLDGGQSLISSDVKGSLKKLNLLRNNVAHDIAHQTTDEDVEKLFVGTLGNRRKASARNGSVWIKLSSYKATIFTALFDVNLSKI